MLMVWYGVLYGCIWYIWSLKRDLEVQYKLNEAWLSQALVF